MPPLLKSSRSTLKRESTIFESGAPWANNLRVRAIRSHQRDVAVVEASFDNILFGDAVSGGFVEGDVDATFFHVAGNVLPEIRQLQRCAGGVREALAMFIAISAEIKNQAADGIGGVFAIVEKRRPVWVALDFLVLAKGF